MTVRAVLAVGLALSICGVALPVMADATATRADAAGAREADTAADAVTRLIDSDAVAGPGARETVTVALPEGPGTGVAALAVGDVPGTGSKPAVAYRVEGAGWRVVTRLPATVCASECGDPLVVRADARLTLRLDREGGERVVRATARPL